MHKKQSVAIVGTRFSSYDIEHQVLDPLDVEIRLGGGNDTADLLRIAADATVVMAGAAPKFDADVIHGLRGKGIVRYGVGTDSIDLSAASQAGILVANVPDYGGEAVAIHTIAMILTSIRRLEAAGRAVWSGTWSFAGLRPLHEPRALAAGVIGYGRIGRLVARHLLDLGFMVMAADPVAAGDANVPLVKLEELLARADVITLHAPAREGAEPLLGEHQFGMMRAGATVVNTSRGSLIDTAALLRALESGRVGHASLDVYPSEPPALENLSAFRNSLTLTPHMAWYTEESERDLRTQTASAARDILRGDIPPSVVAGRWR
ncbi:MAG TPA: C-terminal binding protein [Streptosporangiaceae bacterium]|nr:C-terminal binding protein [Streptosporangiaceae bacterium]